MDCVYSYRLPQHQRETTSGNEGNQAKAKGKAMLLEVFLKSKSKSAEMFPQTRWIGGRTNPSDADAKTESVTLLREQIDLDFFNMELSKTKHKTMKNILRI